MKHLLMLLGILLVASLPLAFKHKKTQSEYERDNVLLVYSANGSCTGVKVRGKKTGKYCILTAGHCRSLMDENHVVSVQTEDKKRFSVQLIEEDLKSDLLLFEGIDHNAVDVADSVQTHELVHSMTHGNGYASHRSDGELLNSKLTPIPYFPVITVEDALKCQGEKFTILPWMFGMMCAINVPDNVSNAKITPGSSGGPLFNSNSELIGIASATDGNFSFWVRLSDIKSFLADK